MESAGEYGNIPSWVADGPHCCDFEGDTCDDLRWSVMLLDAQNRSEMAYFIAGCGRALSGRHSKYWISNRKRQFWQRINTANDNTGTEGNLQKAISVVKLKMGMIGKRGERR